MYLSGLHVAVISPHSDDAALSIGGLLWRLREETQLTLLTVFSRSAWAAPFSQFAGAGEKAVSKERIAEDTRYAAAIKAKLGLLGFADSSLRGYDAISERSSTLRPCLGSHDVATALNARLSALNPQVVVAPAAIGDHVDHILVSAAARLWCETTGVALLLYQDLPYAAEPTLQSVSPPNIVQAIDMPIEIELNTKLANLKFYRTQIDASTCQTIASHAIRIGFGRASERLWSLP